ncbi:MAG: ABC transporter permease, partial [Defluviitaleaceae bacterium]|nr:ABC transporter permease [Defluviitaleaceae bacterium]
MKKYLSIFRIKFVNTLQYRSAAIAGLTTQFAWGFMLNLGFIAFYRSDPTAFPMQLHETISYIWMQQAFLALYALWFWENDISASITEGNIAYDLVRPIGIYERWFCQSLASRLARAALRFIPILLVGVFLPQPLRLVLPSITQLLLFLTSTALALGVVVAFTMLMYISIFYTISSSGVRLITASLGDFLGGAIIPLPFFPAPWRQIAELLPTGSMMNVPLRIYSGNISGIDALSGMGLQIFWILVLVISG